VRSFVVVWMPRVFTSNQRGVHALASALLHMLTEPWLAKHFGRLGVRLEQIGGPIEHRGQRLPSMTDVPDTISSLNLFVRPLYNSLAAKVRSDHDAVYALRSAG
jgi:hypothetical protein